MQPSNDQVPPTTPSGGPSQPPTPEGAAVPSPSVTPVAPTAPAPFVPPAQTVVAPRPAAVPAPPPNQAPLQSTDIQAAPIAAPDTSAAALNQVAPTPVAPTQTVTTPAAAAPAATLPASPYAAPTVGVVVGGEPTLPGTNTDWVVDPSQAGSAGTGSNKWLKPLLISGGSFAAILLLIGGFYFGYYTNSSLLYSQALKNTGKGYDKLIAYAEEQNQQADKFKGVEGSGDYELSYSKEAYNGNMSVANYEKDTNFKASLKIDDKTYTLETLTIDVKKQYPAIYFKLGGITGLTDSFGSPEMSAKFNALDNAWIAVDEKYLAELAKKSAESDKKNAEPTDEQVFDALKAAGRVNDEYFFSTKEDKRVLEVKEKLGIENIEGHKAHHYVVGVNKSNLKAYLAAQKKAISASKLGTWIKEGNHQTAYDSTFKDFENQSKQIKSSDTFDMWADLKTRMIYKVRASDSGEKDKKNNYGEAGLDYKGGDSYPFFFAGKSKNEYSSSNGRTDFILDTVNTSLTAKAKIRSTGTSEGNFDANFTVKPNNKKLDLKAPANAKMLSQVLNDFGFGDSGYRASGSFSSAAPAKKSNPGLAYFITELDKYNQKAGSYPSLAQLNTPGWRFKNTPNLQQYYSAGNTSVGAAGLAAASGMSDLEAIKDTFVGTPFESIPFWR